MNWASWLLWGFLATVVLTTVSAGAQGLGLTRMNFPYVLGSIFTPNRDRAKLYGFCVHLAAGLVFSLIYVWIFQSLGTAGWWRGCDYRSLPWHRCAGSESCLCCRDCIPAWPASSTGRKRTTCWSHQDFWRCITVFKPQWLFFFRMLYSARSWARSISWPDQSV